MIGAGQGGIRQHRLCGGVAPERVAMLYAGVLVRVYMFTSHCFRG